MKLKVSYPAYTLEDRGLVELGRFYVEYLDLSSWWIILAAKLAVSVRM